jgi:protein-tyrosine phosphatase
VKILFVCTGNICRSPLAEGILKDKLRKKNIPAEVDSAGLENFHVGDPPDNRAVTIARKYAIDITGHRGRLFVTDDFDKFDKVFIMDSFHYAALSGMSRNERDLKKIEYTMNAVEPGKNTAVEDPWYDGMNAFETVYKQLDQACEKIAEWIRNQI